MFYDIAPRSSKKPFFSILIDLGWILGGFGDDFRGSWGDFGQFWTGFWKEVCELKSLGFSFKS